MRLFWRLVEIVLGIALVIAMTPIVAAFVRAFQEAMDNHR